MKVRFFIAILLSVLSVEASARGSHKHHDTVPVQAVNMSAEYLRQMSEYIQRLGHEISGTHGYRGWRADPRGMVMWVNGGSDYILLDWEHNLFFCDNWMGKCKPIQ